MLYIIFRSLSVAIFRIFFRIKVYGKDNIPKKGGFILASNHLSYLDPVALGVASPRRLNFMAKQDLFCNPLFSWLISRLGAFPVRRNSSDISALKEAMRRIKNGNALLIFPEGTRKLGGITLQVQGGIGFLASKLNVPVIPAFINGTEKALPKETSIIKFNKISVYFGKQISIERRSPYQEIAKSIVENIRHLSEDITYGA